MTKDPVPVITELSDTKVRANPDEFAMVLAHLIRNAQDATPATGKVALEVTNSGELAEIRVIDTGNGMSPEFVRQRLFRPFDSTKGVEGMGIGAYQAREYVRRLGGELRVESEPNVGTTVIVTVPVADHVG